MIHKTNENVSTVNAISNYESRASTHLTNKSNTKEKMTNNTKSPDSIGTTESDSGSECCSRSLDETDPKKKGEEIVRNMLFYIENENAYLHFFKQLIELHYFIKSGDSDNLRTFEIIPFRKVSKTKNSKVKKSKKTKNVVSDNVKDTNKHSRYSKNTLLDEIILKPHFTVELQERLELRRAMLDDFKLHCFEDEVFNYFINALIDFEECLIKD